MSAPGRFRIREKGSSRFAWQYDEPCPGFSHVVGGVLRSQCRHEIANSISKVPDHARFVVIDRAEFHFGFEIAAAFVRECVTRNESKRRARRSARSGNAGNV